MHLRPSFSVLILAMSTSITAELLSHDSSIDVNNATAFALITFEPVLSAVGPNTFQNQAKLSTATSEVLVRPNVDTLYSKVVIDLSHSDLILSIPEVPNNRFYVAPFYDLYGNNFANVGSVNQSSPGDYLITISRNDEPGIRIFNETDSEYTKYKGVIKFATVYGSIMFRIVVNNNGTDLNAVHAIQAQLNITTIERKEEPLAPLLTPTLLGNGQLSNAALLLPFEFSLTQATETLQLLAQVNAVNPPEDRSDIKQVNDMFSVAGIDDGQYTSPEGLDYDKVSTIIGDQVQSFFANQSNHGFDQNGWFNLLPSLSGDYHTHYLARTCIAWYGYLQLAPSEAEYPTYLDPTVTTASGSLQLAANESYIMNFSGKPPVTGFWSLTAYNSTNYLVPNALDRYSLGDRSNLTYADGTQVYANSTNDGAFSILIQPADQAPSANWTTNWLPAPAGGGEFAVNLRWYGPTPALTNGTYKYPVVTKQGTVY
ncbi:uncharacterized protein LY89DRAFT_762026 [Mollisia scopiformis]|uniref:DUF1214 domain-containing protein n=1 Tax=Mollisia scopiformis TaxID=149040 RepID=A0A132BCN7_MOLSC|nr:uncharacterized protein LY89DRAFT_762026 [Mollisia scopiformis]KUJ09417.1 hypothetical protein LY89DRAFT_762026 [Mollisia scopiformis]